MNKYKNLLAVFMVVSVTETPLQILRDICMTEHHLEMKNRPYCKKLQEKRIKDYAAAIKKLEAEEFASK